jgi:O-antigen/teichoic acid export membrane protein
LGPATSPRSQATSQGLLGLAARFTPGALIPAAVGIAMTSAFTRLLSKEEFGAYSLILSVTAIGAILGSQWLQCGVGRQMPGATGGALTELKRSTARALILVVVGIAAVTGMLWAALGRALGEKWQGVAVPAMLFTSASCVFNTLATVLQAQMRATRFTIYTAFNALLRFATCLLWFFLVSEHWVGLFWASTAGLTLVIPLMWKDAQLPFGPSAPASPRPPEATIGGLAAYGVPLTGWFFAAAVLNWGDRLVINWYRGAAEVGVYSANYALVSKGVGLVAAPILLAAHPMLMKAWTQGETQRAGRFLGRIVQWFVLVGVLLVGGFALLSNDIARVFLGPAFREGAAVMPVVLAGEVVWQLGMYVQKPFEFARRTGTMLVVSIGAAVVNTALNLILVPRFGYMVAAYTTLGSYAIYAGTCAIGGQRVLRWRIEWVPLLHATAFVSIGIVAVAGARRMVERAGGRVEGLMVAIVGLVAIAAFVAVKYLKPMLAGEERGSVA